MGQTPSRESIAELRDRIRRERVRDEMGFSLQWQWELACSDAPPSEKFAGMMLRLFGDPDPRHTAEVIIMQRLHERDLSGHVLENDPDFVHLRLPAVLDTITFPRCRTSIGWEDPRPNDGDLLWPERF